MQQNSNSLYLRECQYCHYTYPPSERCPSCLKNGKNLWQPMTRLDALQRLTGDSLVSFLTKISRREWRKEIGDLHEWLYTDISEWAEKK